MQYLQYAVCVLLALVAGFIGYGVGERVTDQTAPAAPVVQEKTPENSECGKIAIESFMNVGGTIAALGDTQEICAYNVETRRWEHPKLVPAPQAVQTDQPTTPPAPTK